MKTYNKIIALVSFSVFALFPCTAIAEQDWYENLEAHAVDYQHNIDKVKQTLSAAEIATNLRAEIAKQSMEEMREATMPQAPQAVMARVDPNDPACEIDLNGG